MVGANGDRYLRFPNSNQGVKLSFLMSSTTSEYHVLEPNKDAASFLSKALFSLDHTVTAYLP